MLPTSSHAWHGHLSPYCQDWKNLAHASNIFYQLKKSKSSDSGGYINCHSLSPNYTMLEHYDNFSNFVPQNIGTFRGEVGLTQFLCVWNPDIFVTWEPIENMRTFWLQRRERTNANNNDHLRSSLQSRPFVWNLKYPKNKISDFCQNVISGKVPLNLFIIANLSKFWGE